MEYNKNINKEYILHTQLDKMDITTNNKNNTDIAVSLVVIGMAGSGKTTFIQKLVSELNIRKTSPYVTNLDPAVYTLPYPVNIDIRESINFKNVMKQYKLGPNGGIVTCLNLFTTKFDQIYQILEKRKIDHKYLLFDTPGQIEIFTWSASGTIICQSLSTLSPTILLYIIDTEKSSNPITFMSNMLHACSVMYRLRVPLILIFNKIDRADYKQIVGWLTNFELFEQAIDNNDNNLYILNLVRSLNLVLDEFYCNLTYVGISSITGEGIDTFIENIIPSHINDYKATNNNV